MISVMDSGQMVASTPARLRIPDAEQRRHDDSAPLREGVCADHVTGSAFDDPERSDFGAQRSPLVTSSISQQNRIEVYPVSLRVKRPGRGNSSQVPPDRSGTTIEGFSNNSRRGVRHKAVNAFPALISQFGLTYHDKWPSDGRISKDHLNAWLTRLRYILPGVGYLWILEFQKRKAPHYHVFLTISPDLEIWNKLASAWIRIIDGTDDSLWWHGPDRGENWITWDIGTGSYLCKYLDKEAQKAVPEGYFNFGRFWGNSRNLVPSPITIPLENLDDATTSVDRETGEITGGSITVIRWLGRLADKQTKGYSRFRKRAQSGSYTILQGAAAYRRIEDYLIGQREKSKPDIPF